MKSLLLVGCAGQELGFGCLGQGVTDPWGVGMGCCTGVRLLERALAVWAEVCRLGWAGGAGVGQLQGCQGV